MPKFSVESLKGFADSRFELVLYLSQRARDISAGSKALVDCKDDKWSSGKPVLIAYKEMSEGLLKKHELREELMQKLRCSGSVADFSISKFYGDSEKQNKMEEKLRNTAEAVFYGDDIPEDIVDSTDLKQGFITEVSDEVDSSVVDEDELSDLNLNESAETDEESDFDDGYGGSMGGRDRFSRGEDD